MRKLLLVLLVGIAALAAAYGYIVTRSFSAREKPSALEAAIARRLRGLATKPSVKALINPLPATPLNIGEARNHFADHCAFCHGNDGGGKTAINEGLYPPAPDLREAATQALSDGEIFSIIRNGIRFTGMPGFGGGDEENWKLALFIRHLPKLGTDELELMREINPEETQKHHH
jgi:mono/diheme cytochrome c family protein